MHIANGVWLPDEAKQSSTWRELVAVKRVLQAVANRLNGSRIRWFTDNQNVVRILTVGSGKCCLQDVALQIFALCMSCAIHIEPEWISRIVDYDDWYVNPAVFAWVEELWGPHTVDRFASHYNMQLLRFNSRFACPGAEAVDALPFNGKAPNSAVFALRLDFSKDLKC